LKIPKSIAGRTKGPRAGRVYETPALKPIENVELFIAIVMKL